MARLRWRGTLAIIGTAAIVAAAILAVLFRLGVLWHGSPAVYRDPPPRYLVMFVLDGARPDYFGLTRLPHVDALRKRGTQFTNAIDGILESETPAGHATLATGSTPRRSGILGFNWSQDDNDFSLFSPDVIRSGTVERIIENYQAPTIAGLYKKRFPHATAVALSGHKYYAADPLGGPDADAIMYYQPDTKGNYVPVGIPGHMPPSQLLSDPALASTGGQLGDGKEDHLAVKLGLASFRVMRPRLLMINLPEFDWPLGHVFGGALDRQNAISLMKGFDDDLGRVEQAYRKAGILHKTLFVITSDHGMAPITRFVSSTVISNALARAGTTAPAIAWNDSAYIWLRDPGKAQAVAQNIARARDPGVLSVYYLDTQSHPAQYLPAPDLPVSPALDAANRYLLNTLMNGHQPAVVVIGRSDATMSNPSNHWKADHGGPAWQSQHIPLIMAGPGIRRGAVIPRPAQLDDVAPTVLTAMGVRPAGMEGRALTDALKYPTLTAQRERRQELNELVPVVRALKAEDIREEAQPL